VETTVTQAEAVPGEPLKLHHTATVHASVPVRWMGVRYPKTKLDLTKPAELRANETATLDSTQTLPTDTPVSQPYWLREEPSTGLYHVDDPALIGRPENPPAFPVEQVFEISGQTIVIPDEPVQVATGPTSDAWKRRRLDVIPPVTLKFPFDVRLFAAGASKEVEVEVTAFRANTAGDVHLDAAPGWKVEPGLQPFRLRKVGEQARLKFHITAPGVLTHARITARAKVGSATFSNQRVEIRYDHIPVQVLQPPAQLRAVTLDLAVRGKKVGYLPGAGDSVAECLAEMGYKVTLLSDADLTTNRLKEFDAVVIGIRAYNTRTNLGAHLPQLFSYIENGGTVVAQYNRDGVRTSIAPYSLRISNDRVTDENAKMTFLAPEHPALNTPNRISQADFDGWVQERGIYFPNEWDGEHFTPILACNDPGEAPKKGVLLIAPYGKGYFVYTGLDFFRQLPDGVPGAYRLFANLVSLGK
jgi:hypothetical protein